jgi:hypothetical protein
VVVVLIFLILALYHDKASDLNPCIVKPPPLASIELVRVPIRLRYSFILLCGGFSQLLEKIYD